MSDPRVAQVLEALRHPIHVAPLPTNEVIELRMPLRVYNEALIALDGIAAELEASERTMQRALDLMAAGNPVGAAHHLRAAVRA